MKKACSSYSMRYLLSEDRITKGVACILTRSHTGFRFVRTGWWVWDRLSSGHRIRPTFSYPVHKMCIWISKWEVLYV